MKRSDASRHNYDLNESSMLLLKLFIEKIRKSISVHI